MLMAMYGIDSEEGEDIPQQGKSYFLDLLQQGAVNHLRWFNSSLQTTRSCWSSSSTMRSRSTSTRRRGTRGREQRPNLPSSSRRRPSSKLDQTCVRSFRVWTNLVFGQHFYLYKEIAFNFSSTYVMVSVETVVEFQIETCEIQGYFTYVKKIASNYALG